MIRVFLFASLAMGLAFSIVSSLGCAQCCAPFDYDYGAYGGVNQRADMRFGRVGSPFSDGTVGSGVTQESITVQSGGVSGEIIHEGSVLEGEVIQGEVIHGQPTPASNLHEYGSGSR